MTYLDSVSSRRRAIGALLVIGALITPSIVASPAAASERPVGEPETTASTTPPTVSLPVQTVDTPGRGGQNGTIEMRVGKSAPLRVIVDTGFSGLIVFPGAWDRRPGGVRQSKTRVKVDAGSLGVVSGFPGTATMTFGGVTTVTEVPFVSVAKANPYLRQWTKNGVYGLLGVGTKGAGLINPLSTLPGVLGLRWSIHFQRTQGKTRNRRGELILGARGPLNPTMSLSMPYLGTDVNGARLWDDQATPGCWRFGQRPEVCLPTQLDAAFNITRVRGSRFRSLKTNKDGNLRTGTLVRWAAPGSAFVGVRYKAGNKPSVNLTRVIPKGSGQVIVGNTLYFDNVVTYDTVTGTVSIKEVRQKGSS